MKLEFIKVKSIIGHHVIRVSEIINVSDSKDIGTDNKSSIAVLNKNTEFYSTETASEILDKINGYNFEKTK